MTSWRCVGCWKRLRDDPCRSPYFCRTCRDEIIHRIRIRWMNAQDHRMMVNHYSRFHTMMPSIIFSTQEPLQSLGEPLRPHQIRWQR